MLILVDQVLDSGFEIYLNLLYDIGGLMEVV